MNTNQSTSQNTSQAPVNGAIFNQADAKAQLKKIGDQIESLAKKWESQNTQIDCDALYELGDQVEHFLDASSSQVKEAKLSNKSNVSYQEGSSFQDKAAFDEDRKDRLS